MLTRSLTGPTPLSREAVQGPRWSVSLARGLAHFGRAFALLALAAQVAMVAVGLVWVLQGRVPLDNFLANEGLLFGASIALGLSLRWWCGRILEKEAGW